MWAYPLIGSGVGALVAATIRAGAALGVPPLPAAALALAAGALFTGGLHEDGFADTVDALSGGRTAERRSAILRDSRIGAHGALALGLVVLVRASALAALPAPGVVPAAVAASVIARTAILPVLLLARPARSDGLGASLATAGRRRAVVGIALGVALACPLAPWRAIVAGLLAGAGFAVWAARRRFGGYTGDLLGAAAILGETVSLLLSLG